MPEQLKLSPLQSFVNASFFQKLSNLKLNDFKLDTTKKKIIASYDIESLPLNSNTAINITPDSFEEINELLYPHKSVSFLHGHITNLNTVEDFKNLDKAKFLSNSGSEIVQSIQDKSVLKDPSKLNKFEIISFADFKKFKFYYWFAFPTVSSKFYIVDKKELETTPDLTEWINGTKIDQMNYFLIKNSKPAPLSELEIGDKEVTIGFIDTCVLPDKPSKLLQNYLTALAHYGFTKITVNIIRISGKSYELVVEPADVNLNKITGWERTTQGKLSPKLADLASLIDPIKLTEQSVDLNLKLMKWRVAPVLDLEIIKETKVLLLGAGTLGSYVARTLLGWGVRNITLVDNGKVSHSNPVRQPLFNFEDVGKPKAQQAAESLKKIFPLVNAKGYELEISMVGHPITNNERQKKDFDQLVELIDANDAIFLLTDSREARWLPTLIGNVKKKIVINAALGFDSYLVMRHGVEGNLGCYFCSDVVAPSDSLSNRTLDQMCTVTRPGVALLASSLAVELLVSLLQHPQKHYAAPTETTILGELPHQLRGFLADHKTMKLDTPAYDYCSACSKPIQEAYIQEGWGFITKALKDSHYLEEVSGLAEVQRKAEEAVVEIQEDLGFFDDDW